MKSNGNFSATIRARLAPILANSTRISEFRKSVLHALSASILLEPKGYNNSSHARGHWFKSSTAHTRKGCALCEEPSSKVLGWFLFWRF